jgi:hypothetical protein
MKLSARNQLKGKITEVKKGATTTQNVSAGLLVAADGKALGSDDRKYSRKLTAGDNAKQVATQLLRRHYNTTRTGPRGFNDRGHHPKIRY